MINREETFFCVSTHLYNQNTHIDIKRPASLSNPKDNAVMFITSEYINQASVLSNCSDCLVFWPSEITIPKQLINRHVFVLSEDPHLDYCKFFRDNNITNLPPKENYDLVEGALIAKGAVIGDDCTILPGALIGGEVHIGDNCYIGSGAKLVGRVSIGDNVVIRENSVIGADGLSTDRDSNGRAVTMPQFGGVVIEDDVQIGALTVIARGAIDDTIIKRGAKIDNSAFISHNVCIGEDTFVVGETIMFGSSSTGSKVLVSGGVTVANRCHVGDCSVVGMGSAVLKDVNEGSVVKGIPAK